MFVSLSDMQHWAYTAFPPKWNLQNHIQRWNHCKIGLWVCYLHGVANIHSGEYNVSTPQQSLLREQTSITLYPGRSLLANLYFRTQFKILTYSYKSLHGLAPSYTKNFIFEYKPHQITAMCASLIRTKTYEERQLSTCGMISWRN